MISFAGQGAGRVLWPSVAVTARLVVAAGSAGSRWRSSAAAWRRSPPSSPLSFVAYGGFASLVMIFGSAWHSRQAQFDPGAADLQRTGIEDGAGNLAGAVAREGEASALPVSSWNSVADRGFSDNSLPFSMPSITCQSTSAARPSTDWRRRPTTCRSPAVTMCSRRASASCSFEIGGRPHASGTPSCRHAECGRDQIGARFGCAR